jgi:phage shock protein PspC (stress-responsive transcriptional regulator)
MSGIAAGLGRPLGVRRTLARWITGPGAYTLTFVLLVVAFVALALQLPEGTSPDGPQRAATQRTQ